MWKPNQRGLVLIASVMLIIFVSISVLGVSVFIINKLTINNSDLIKTQTVYLAQGGLNRAVYDFRFHDIAANGYFSLGKTTIDAQNSFTLSATAADLLMVNTATAALANSNRDIVNLIMQNAANSTLTITRMIVSWNNTQHLRRIDVSGTVVWTGNVAVSPATAILSPTVTLNSTLTTTPITRIRFGGSMSGATVSVQFVMSDASTRTVTVYQTPALNNNIFTVTSKGEITGSTIVRTLQADYNALTGKISPLQEK